jgi:hypothetical protein
MFDKANCQQFAASSGNFWLVIAFLFEFVAEVKKLRIKTQMT